ncbi:MAG: hypothetical protein ACM3YE_14580 [Bacteroidota bacterium]
MFENKTKSVELDYSDFKEIAAGAFGFLVKEYGFRLVKFDNNTVRYQTAKVFVNISLGRASMEIKVDLGLLPNQYDEVQHKFSLTEIIELLVDQRDSEYLYFQGLNKEQLQKHLPQLAELVKKYAKDVLKGDYLIIQNLERLRSDTSVGLSKEARIRQSLFD